MTVKAISFVAKSGTGKTTLLEKVISCLKERGYRVGVIKHDAHRFDIDHSGKDSHRLTVAGADTMLIASPEKLALVKKHAASPSVEELLTTYFTDVDIVLAEGFKRGSLPKIELHRQERSATLICRGEENDPTLQAVASDEPLELDVPVLNLNDADAVADFIEERFLKLVTLLPDYRYAPKSGWRSAASYARTGPQGMFKRNRRTRRWPGSSASPISSPVG